MNQTSPTNRIPPYIIRLLQGSGGGATLIALLYFIGFLDPSVIPPDMVGPDPVPIEVTHNQVLFEVSVRSQSIYRVIADTVPVELFPEVFLDSLDIPSNHIFTKVLDIKGLKLE